MFFLRGPILKRIHRIYENFPHKFDCSKLLEKIGTNAEEDAIENTDLPVEVPLVENKIYSISRLGMFQHDFLFLGTSLTVLNILHDIIKKGKTSNQLMYTDYVNECNRKRITDRTFNAFRAALLRAKKRKE